MQLVWKFATEFLGTFLLILAILLYSNPLILGAAFAGIVWLAKDRSGAHINPAVSIVKYLGGKLSMNELGGYVASQIAGAISCLYMFKVFA